MKGGTNWGTKFILFFYIYNFFLLVILLTSISFFRYQYSFWICASVSLSRIRCREWSEEGALKLLTNGKVKLPPRLAGSGDRPIRVIYQVLFGRASIAARAPHFVNRKKNEPITIYNHQNNDINWVTLPASRKVNFQVIKIVKENDYFCFRFKQLYLQDSYTSQGSVIHRLNEKSFHLHNPPQFYPRRSLSMSYATEVELTAFLWSSQNPVRQCIRKFGSRMEIYWLVSMLHFW